MSNTNTEVLLTAYENLQKAITQANTVLPNLESAIETGDLQNYAKASDLEEKSNDIDVLKRNRIFNCSVFGNPNCFTNNQPYLLSDLQNLKKIGVDSIMITARTELDTDGVHIKMTQDIDTLLYIYETALSLGLKTSAIRVSASSYNNSGYDFITNWDTWNVEYTTVVNSVLEAFKDKDIPYFIAFNETEKITVDYDSAFTQNPYTNTGTAQETYVVNTLNNVKTYGFKTGINTASIRYANFVTDAIAAVCDVLFINSYFQIGTAGSSMGLTNRVNEINSMVDSMYTPVQEKFAGKELFIGECGIKSYWEAMLSASAWDFSNYDEVANGKPIEYYWESIFNSSLQSKVKGIGIWFHEDIKEDNLEFFHRYIGRWE